MYAGRAAGLAVLLIGYMRGNTMTQEQTNGLITAVILLISAVTAILTTLNKQKIDAIHQKQGDCPESVDPQKPSGSA